MDGSKGLNRKQIATEAALIGRDAYVVAGVINQDSDAYIKNPDEWHAIKGSLEAIRRLNDAVAVENDRWHF